MQIYWFRAQAPRRVLALVKHLNIPAEFVQLDIMKDELKSAAYARLNPNQKAPTIKDGDKVLWESSAIMAYLCQKVGSDMWPTNAAAEQIEIMRWLGWNDCHWAPAIGDFYFEHVVKATFGIGDPDRDLLKQKEPMLRTYAKVLDDHLATSGGYVACGRLTIADFHLASMATDWKKAEMPFGDFPDVRRWLERLDELPAWRSPWPSA